MKYQQLSLFNFPYNISKKNYEIILDYQFHLRRYKKQKYKIQMLNILIDFCKRKKINLDILDQDIKDML